MKTNWNELLRDILEAEKKTVTIKVKKKDNCWSLFRLTLAAIAGFIIGTLVFLIKG